MGEKKQEEALDGSLVTALAQPHEQTGPKPYINLFAPCHAVVHKPPNNKTWCILTRTHFETPDH